MLPFSFPHRWRDDHAQQRSTRGLAWVGLLLALTTMPGFGAVVGSTQTADVFARPSVRLSTGVTLDNALVANRAGARDNLDLLLQMPTAAPGTADLSVAPPRAGFRGATPRAPAMVDGATRADTRAAVVAASALLGTDAGLALPQANQQRPPRDWTLEAAGGGVASRDDGSGLAADDSGGAVPAADLRALQQPLLQLMQLLRDSRGWLLGGLVLLLLLGAVLKGLSRRI